MDLAEENRRLRQRLRYLTRNQAHLEQRLDRVENSVLFRFLRWIGSRFAKILALFDRQSDRSDDPEYAAWVRETTVSDPRCRGDDVNSRISLISATSAPGPFETPFTGLVGGKAILEPDAIRAWLTALENGADVVYSDWDLIDKEGRRHSPRFTPEFSPELLAATPYWGCCFAARTQLIRKTGWSGADPHDLSRRLANQGGSIVRVAQILWHLPDAHAFPLEPAYAVSKTNETASIIICSRNAKRLDACLASLAPAVDARHQVIVVAHRVDGDDPELERVAERHGAVSVSYRGAFHFGRMNQLGASAARGSILLLLNDDVRPASHDWLESMLAQASRQEIGIVGAMLFYPSGAIQHAGIVVGDTLLPAHIGRSQRESLYWPWLRMTREVSAVTGACLAIRRSIWDELGGFDLRFPVNYNDVDLCLRAQKRGYRVLIETRATLIHQEAATRIPEVHADERELFWELWSDVLSAPDPFFNPQLEIRDEMICLPRPWPATR